MLFTAEDGGHGIPFRAAFVFRLATNASVPMASSSFAKFREMQARVRASQVELRRERDARSEMAESTQTLTEQALDEARRLRETAAKLEQAVRSAERKRGTADEEEDAPVIIMKKADPNAEHRKKARSELQRALGYVPRRPREPARPLTGEAGPTLYRMALDRLQTAKRERRERLPDLAPGEGASRLNASAVRSHLTAPLLAEAMRDRTDPITHLRIGDQHMAYDLTAMPRMLGDQQYTELRSTPGFQAHLLTCYLDCIARNDLTRPPEGGTDAARVRWCEAYLGITICRALEQKAFKEYTAMKTHSVKRRSKSIATAADLAAQFHSAIQFGAGRH